MPLEGSRESADYYEWTGRAEAFNEKGPVTPPEKFEGAFGFIRQPDGSYEAFYGDCGGTTTWDAQANPTRLMLRLIECSNGVQGGGGGISFGVAYASGTVTFPTSTTAILFAEHKEFKNGQYERTVRWTLNGVEIPPPSTGGVETQPAPWP